MFEDAMTYPEHIIKELKARVRELEEEVKRLKPRVGQCGIPGAECTHGACTCRR